MTIIKDIAQKCQKNREIRKQKLLQKRAQQELIIAEQHALSYALMQKLVTVYEQNKNNIAINRDTYSGIRPPCNQLMVRNKNTYEVMYTLSQEVYSPYRYYMQIPNGIKLEFFGYHKDDGTFLHDEKYDYVSALYDLTETGRMDRPNPAISYLKEISVNPDLHSTQAWPSEKMAVFSYLNRFLQNTK